MLLALQAIVDQLSALQAQIGTLERGIHTQHRATEASRRLENIPGIDIIGATAIATAVTMRVPSNRDENSPHGSASCHDSIRLAASKSSVAYRSKATVI